MSQGTTDRDAPAGAETSDNASDATDLRVAVAHYPEGAGHATRMLAVGQAFEERGAEIFLAGGGPGTAFLEANGYESYEPTLVDYIDDFQDGGNLLRVITRSVPRSGLRVLDYVRWLRRTNPALLVTDDMFAAMAAPLARTPLYFLTHNAPGFYDEDVERVFTALLTRIQSVASRVFFYPAVWPEHEVDPDGVIRVPPIALEGAPAEADGGGEGDGAGPAVDKDVDKDGDVVVDKDGDVVVDKDGDVVVDKDGDVVVDMDVDVAVDVDVDVLLVPSHYSTGFAELGERLEAEGRSVTRVGSDEWETAPSMLPYMRAASVVVCSGYSTIMEAAVANTPCVIYPFTDEQEGVARVIEEGGSPGFRVVQTADGVAGAVADPPVAPTASNGAGVIAERILSDLSDGDNEDASPRRGGWLGGARA